MTDEERLSWEKTFVANMIEARERVEMSQTELARRVRAEGVACHQQTIQRIEQRARAPRLNEAQAITAVLFNGQWDRAIALVDAPSLHRMLSDAVETLAELKRLHAEQLWDRLRTGYEAVRTLGGVAEKYVQVCEAEGVDADEKLLLRAEQVEADWMAYLEQFLKAGLIKPISDMTAEDGNDRGEHQEEA